MGITLSNKEISTSTIDCGGEFNITLSLAGEPDIVSNPTDIVLILDRSGSMSGSPLTNLKAGVKKFIDIIDEATDSSQDGQIGSGSRIGIVSFATSASQDTQLITSVSDLKDAVDALSASGSTNHADAFSKATDLFDPTSTNGKVMVMFTDGKTTIGPDPAPVAASAKAQGIIIYCIGLIGSEGIDENALNDWASDPDSSYVAITPDDDELEDLFEDLASNIAKPGATGIEINETVNSCFQITGVSMPTKGNAFITDETSLKWTIDKLGVTSSEGAAVTFTARHVGPCTGTVEVNKSISYSDNENNTVNFQSPEILIFCPIDVFPEECPQPINITIAGCEDSIEYNAGELAIESQGRILQLDVTIKNICPGKRTALGIVLTEVDNLGVEHKRGLKTVTIPSHGYDTCKDVTVRCIKFVLPEDLDVSGGSTTSTCNDRYFNARFIAHYIDNDFDCCPATI